MLRPLYREPPHGNLHFSRPDSTATRVPLLQPRALMKKAYEAGYQQGHTN